MNEQQPTLYGVVKFVDGYAVFWAGRLDAERYPTRAAAIRELGKRDVADVRQPTPCQQQQANAGAANDVLVDALALIADAAATVAALPTCGEREVLTEIASLARAALAKVQS